MIFQKKIKEIENMIKQNAEKSEIKVLIKFCNIFKISLNQIFSVYLDIEGNKSLAYPIAGYEKLSKEEKETIEHLIMYFNKQ